MYNDAGTNAAKGLRPYRQFYLSLDVDLRRIPTRSVLLKRVFYALSIFHLPAPALEYNAAQRFRLPRPVPCKGRAWSEFAGVSEPTAHCRGCLRALYATA